MWKWEYQQAYINRRTQTDTKPVRRKNRKPVRRPHRSGSRQQNSEDTVQQLDSWLTRKAERQESIFVSFRWCVIRHLYICVHVSSQIVDGAADCKCRDGFVGNGLFCGGTVIQVSLSQFSNLKCTELHSNSLEPNYVFSLFFFCLLLCSFGLKVSYI